MKRWKATVIALLLLAWLAPAASGQQPPPTTPPTTGSTTPAVPAPPPQASGIVGLVQMAAAACQACKAKICACPIGQLLTNAMGPMNMLAGGLICKPCCPPVPDADSKKPSTTAAGACARVTKDTQESRDRIKSVKCLAYIDCHWWPEAEMALISSLRTDKNECVRLATAQVLLTGCCCTKNVIETLTIVVTKSSKDGNPSENSQRVIDAAYLALQNCLIRYHEVVLPAGPAEKPPPKPPIDVSSPGLKPVAYYVNSEGRSLREVLAEAHRAMDRPLAAKQSLAPPTGSRSLYSILMATKPPGPLQTAAPPIDGVPPGHALVP